MCVCVYTDALVHREGERRRETEREGERRSEKDRESRETTERIEDVQM